VSAAATPWTSGRFDAKRGPSRVLFGRMYEDTDVERSSFAPGGRVFCIASAGCTALRLSERHDVVACDINPVQLAYAERRLAGAPMQTGTAEAVMGFARGLMPLAGWRLGVVEEFLGMADADAQAAFFRDRLDTWVFRAGFDALLSGFGLRAVYAPAFLSFLPRQFGAVLRSRLQRGFARHPNATNPYARALLLGTPEPVPTTSDAKRIELVLSDAASYLESCPPASFDGFTLSNVTDGASREYASRLFAAVRRAAAPGAVLVTRSFGEPARDLTTNRAGDDRSLLWGIVDVRPAKGAGEG